MVSKKNSTYTYITKHVFYLAIKKNTLTSSAWRRMESEFIVLNEISQSVIVRRKMAPKRSGTIRRCDLVGIGVVLLEEVYPCGDEL